LYGYFDNEGYGKPRSTSTIRKLLLAIFILLNLSVIYTTITHGKKWYCRFCDTMKEHAVQVSNIYSAAGISMATFNFVYLTSTAWLYTGYFIYPSLITVHVQTAANHLTLHLITKMRLQPSLSRG